MVEDRAKSVVSVDLVDQFGEDARHEPMDGDDGTLPPQPAQAIVAA
jgi:hypothetical protein